MAHNITISVEHEIKTPEDAGYVNLAITVSYTTGAAATWDDPGYAGEIEYVAVEEEPPHKYLDWPIKPTPEQIKAWGLEYLELSYDYLLERAAEEYDHEDADLRRELRAERDYNNRRGI